MCYSALVEKDLDYLEKHFGAIAVRESFDWYTKSSLANPKKFHPITGRVYPGSYAPVMYHDTNGELLIKPMRYGAYPPPSIKNAAKYTTFNARRDNLTSDFWSGAFMKHHGYVVLEAFFEWVAVKDLLKAGVVKLPDVEKEFAKQAKEREAKIKAAGKKYKPTPTELKPARDRQIIIQFTPANAQKLLAPVIFSTKKLDDGYLDAGFALITDEPNPEVRAAGHDRSPIILESSAINDWLHFQGKTAKQMDQLLADKQMITFGHMLPLAA
jgi:putative SOS response-associated peptidase YedK